MDIGKKLKIMHVKSNEIIEKAHCYIGVPYRHKGRTKHGGVDCAGLVILVAKDIGVGDGFDTVDYSHRPNVQEFDKNMIAAGCKRLPLCELSNGDILRVREPNWPVHTCIYEIDDRRREWVIHAYLPFRKVVREELSQGRRDRISSVWRYPEI